MNSWAFAIRHAFITSSSLAFSTPIRTLSIMPEDGKDLNSNIIPCPVTLKGVS